MEKNITIVLNKFLENVSVVQINILQSGLINSTYKVATNQGVYVLQKMNQKVFTNIHSLLNNKTKVTQYLKNLGFPTIDFITAKDGLSYTEYNNDIWQLSIYIPSVVKEKIDNTNVAEKAGYFLGEFHKALLNFPITELEYTLPNFHNTIKRYNDFVESINTATPERLQKAESEIALLKDKFHTIQEVAFAIQNGKIPLRVVHNDTKISNMLFNDAGNIICLIDYDTIMPGSILHDIGDALRTVTNTATEEEMDLQKVNFNSEIYKHFLQGYTKAASSFITDDELKNIHLALPLLLFEQACRFLADYLNNDSYYTAHYDDNNLVRAKTQIHLLQQVFIYLNRIN